MRQLEPPCAATVRRFFDLPNIAALLLALPLLPACGGRTGLTEGTEYLIATAGSSGGTGSDGGAGTDPGPPRAPERVLAVSAGDEHTCAVLSDHHVKCWGANSTGQLGNGTQSRSAPPADVLGLSHAIAVYATYEFTCALLDNGTVSCWGRNNHGQLGIVSNLDQSVPTTVTGISTAVAVGIGSQHGCAVLNDGHIDCWGYNGHGQLGNGTNSYDSTPAVQVIAREWTSAMLGYQWQW